MDTSGADFDGREDVARAEEVLWTVVKQAMERRGEHEAVRYLRHWLRAGAEEVVEEGAYRRVRFEMYQRLSDYSARYNANTGVQMSWFFDALMDDGGRMLPEAECLEIARQAVEVPPGAVLEVAQYEEQAGTPVFVARWGHRHHGIPVERDYIHVLVNGNTGKAFSLRRRWHEVDGNYTVR